LGNIILISICMGKKRYHIDYKEEAVEQGIWKGGEDKEIGVG